MSLKVMVVDDSAVVRGLVCRALEEDGRITVAGTAGNGQLAIDMARSLKPAVIILDIEMPVMDGLTALPLILQASPASRIIMSSSLTQQNAAVNLKALEMGAADTIGKPSAKTGTDADMFYEDLRRKVLALGGESAAYAAPASKPEKTDKAPAAAAQPARYLNEPLGLMRVDALAIASSTGGPQTLMTLFGELKGRLRNIPIFVTQHMPPSFTAILAEHLGKISDHICREAKDGDIVQPGHVYIAPGDYHMLAEKNDKTVIIRLTQDQPENFCRPAADPMLRSLSRIYGSHLAALVLTGMGQDGMLGCKEVVANGGAVAAQDQPTSVVYGMPKAVADQNLCKAILPLPEIAQYLIKNIEGRR